MTLNRGQISLTSGAFFAHSDGVFAHLGPIERESPPILRYSGAIITGIAPKYRCWTRDHRSPSRNLRSFAPDHHEIARE
jgi:hypothetical protein